MWIVKLDIRRPYHHRRPFGSSFLYEFGADTGISGAQGTMHWGAVASGVTHQGTPNSYYRSNHLPRPAEPTYVLAARPLS